MTTITFNVLASFVLAKLASMDFSDHPVNFEDLAANKYHTEAGINATVMYNTALASMLLLLREKNIKVVSDISPVSEHVLILLSLTWDKGIEPFSDGPVRLNKESDEVFDGLLGEVMELSEQSLREELSPEESEAAILRLREIAEETRQIHQSDNVAPIG